MNDSKIKKNVMISGAGGFLGQQIIKQLYNHNYFYVIAITSNKKKIKENFSMMKNLEVVDKDNWMEEIDSNLDINILINCAFARVSKGFELAQSLEFTKFFLRDIADRGVKSIVNISTQSVYSQEREYPVNECSKVVPESLYAMAKYASECLVESICENHNIHFTNIRLASLVGIGFDLRLTTRFIKQAVNNIPIKVTGGKQVISYMDVKDAAGGIIALISTDYNKWEKIYNLGNQESHTLLDIANMIKSIAPNYISNPVTVELEVKDVFINSSMDSSKFHNDFLWQPKYNIQDVIKEQFEYSVKGNHN